MHRYATQSTTNLFPPIPHLKKHTHHPSLLTNPCIPFLLPAHPIHITLQVLVHRYMGQLRPHPSSPFDTNSLSDDASSTMILPWGVMSPVFQVGRRQGLQCWKKTVSFPHGDDAFPTSMHWGECGWLSLEEMYPQCCESGDVWRGRPDLSLLRDEKRCSETHDVSKCLNDVLWCWGERMSPSSKRGDVFPVISFQVDAGVISLDKSPLTFIYFSFTSPALCFLPFFFHCIPARITPPHRTLQ